MTAAMPLYDRRWEILGLQLTTVVHAARLEVGIPASPIRPAGLGSLQAAAASC